MFSFIESLSRANGFLTAFEALNIGVNCVPTFQLINLPGAGSTQECVERHLQPNENYAVELSKIQDWQNWISKDLSERLFSNLRLHDESKAEAVVKFLLLLDEVLNGKLHSVYRVTISSSDGRFLRPFYEADWSDYLFDCGATILLLHLGVSD